MKTLFLLLLLAAPAMADDDYKIRFEQEDQRRQMEEIRRQQADQQRQLDELRRRNEEARRQQSRGTLGESLGRGLGGVGRR